MSSDSSADDLLAGYLAGRVTAERLVSGVAAEYYRGTRNGKRETWAPIMDVVERAHPGIVALTAREQHPGFEVRLAERLFPKQYELELRQAVQQVLQTLPVSRVPFPDKSTTKPGLLRRIVAAVRKLFSA